MWREKQVLSQVGLRGGPALHPWTCLLLVLRRYALTDSDRQADPCLRAAVGEGAALNPAMLALPTKSGHPLTAWLDQRHLHPALAWWTGGKSGRSQGSPRLTCRSRHGGS